MLTCEEVNTRVRDIVKYFDSIEEIAVSYSWESTEYIMQECDSARENAFKHLKEMTTLICE